MTAPESRAAARDRAFLRSSDAAAARRPRTERDLEGYLLVVAAGIGCATLALESAGNSTELAQAAARCAGAWLGTDAMMRLSRCTALTSAANARRTSVLTALDLAAAAMMVAFGCLAAVLSRQDRLAIVLHDGEFSAGTSAGVCLGAFCLLPSWLKSLQARFGARRGHDGAP